MLSSEEFAEWSADQILFLHVTTRVEGDKYQTLLRDKGFRGFPSLAYMDPAGNVIAKHTGPRTLEGLKKTAAKADAYLALRKQAEAGDRVAQATMFVTDLENGRYGFSEGTLRLAALGDALPTNKRAEAEQILHGVQLQEMTTALRERAQELGREKYAEKYRELMLLFYRAGRLPPGMQASSLLLNVMNHARQEEDAALFAEALDEYKKRVGTNPRYARVLERYEQQLAELKGG